MVFVLSRQFKLNVSQISLKRFANVTEMFLQTILKRFENVTETFRKSN